MRVLIADDESIVLEGLQYIINWEQLGFSIISLAKNGEEALEKILKLHPDLVLLDIRMPKRTGIEIIQLAREQGFQGHFIILSGVSDFSYAQTAIKYGVDFYLTKPIDEEELEQAVFRVKGFIEDDYKKERTFHEYRENARDTIIRNIITGKLKDLHHLNLKDFSLSLDQYQIVIYERYHQAIMKTYPTMEIPFSTNSSIIDLIETKSYLYEIIEILLEQFTMCINALGAPSSETIIDNILYYINHNYYNNLKLETIAPLFGYNSAYLGKLFTKQVGESFNSYLDRVKIEHSKKLLEKNTLKVYEIAERVGYKNVDYFHKKFKKYVGESPAEYRKHFL